MSDEEFAEYMAEALWLKKFDQEKMEAALTSVLNKAFKDPKKK